MVALLGLSTVPPCIVMEWCGLGSLESWLEAQANAGATAETLTTALLTGICKDLVTGKATSFYFILSILAPCPVSAQDPPPPPPNLALL